MTTEQTVSPVVRKGRELLREKKADEAIALLTGHLEKDFADRDAQELLGMACFSARKFDAAKDAFNQLTRIDPKYAAAWVNLGAVQNVLEDYQGATKSLRKAIQKDKKCASAYYNLGIAQKALKMNSMAIGAYKEAIRLDSEMAEAYANLANLYLDMKNPTQAVKTAEAGVDKCPQFKKLRSILANATQQKEGNRRKEAPLGRLVNEDELARKQIRTAPRELADRERTSERETLREHSKTLRRFTKPIVSLLDGPLPQQLHLLTMAAAQQDTRGEAAQAFEQMQKTIGEVDRLRDGSSEVISDIRSRLEKTDPGL